MLKKSYTLQYHGIVCLLVLAAAVVSEIIHEQFFNAAFDSFDIGATIFAQFVLLFVPLLRKELPVQSREVKK